ncbi:putative iron-regulated protein [Oceanisphaera litoralis]|uniref:ChaN family lipoprotein n=1 Tax=Oceanisphaera litoralis TaxID=225144 RepID=UPI0019579F14|nr:ChaN family lipoprotein [Oceanisphaera litoralis]MBM7456423.1 putative iron-regulated protein [Oceanisphaera litoralis]
MRPLILLFTLLLLGGCQAGARPPATLFDYQLYSPTGQPLSLELAARQLDSADVIMVGELHGHPGIHRFQAELLARLLHQPRPLALAMEQFSRDHQATLDAYLAAKLGEDAFIEQSHAWPGYRSDYRPLIELARQARIPVLAANAPRHLVRCIARKGPAYLDQLPAEQRAWVAEQLTLSDDAYKALFMTNRHHGQAPTEFQFAAQTSWDDTMAESIDRYLQTRPGHRVMLTVGRFHIGDGLGTALRLQQRAPGLKVVLIYPVTANETAPAPPLWSLRVGALPAARLAEEPLPSFRLGKADC